MSIFNLGSPIYNQVPSETMYKDTRGVSSNIQSTHNKASQQMTFVCREQLTSKLCILSLLCICLVLIGCYKPATLPSEFLEKTPTTSSSPQSASPAIAPQQLKLAEMMRWILKKSPKAQVRHRFKKVWSSYQKMVVFAENPELRVVRVSPGLFANGKVDDLSIRLRWQPPRPGAYRARVARKEALAKAKQHEQSSEAYQVVSLLRQLYIQWILSHKSYQLQEQQHQLHHKKWLLLKKQVQAGSASIMQSRTARIALIQASWKKQEALRLKKTHWHRIQVLLGSEKVLAEKPPSSLPPLPKLPSVQALQKQILERHPELLALRQYYQVHHATLWGEKNKRYPWLSFIQLSFNAEEDSPLNSISLGLGIRLPFFQLGASKYQWHIEQMKWIALKYKARKQELLLSIKTQHQRLNSVYKRINKQKDILRKEVKQHESEISRHNRQSGVDPHQLYRWQTSILQLKQLHFKQLLYAHLAQIKLDFLASTPIWQRYNIQYKP